MLPQLAGQTCAVCSSPIVIAVTAEFCGRCSCPIHKDCKRDTDPADSKESCAACGATLRRTQEPHHASPEQQAIDTPSPPVTGGIGMLGNLYLRLYFLLLAYIDLQPRYQALAFDPALDVTIRAVFGIALAMGLANLVIGATLGKVLRESPHTARNLIVIDVAHSLYWNLSIAGANRESSSAIPAMLYGLIAFLIAHRRVRTAANRKHHATK
jgi:hypothetical protein